MLRMTFPSSLERFWKFDPGGVSDVCVRYNGYLSPPWSVGRFSFLDFPLFVIVLSATYDAEPE